MRKLLRVSVYVLRFIKLRVWNRVSSEKQRSLKDKLLLSIFDTFEDNGSIKSQEVKLATLLWVSFVQHRRYRDNYVAIQNKKKHCLQIQLGVKADQLEILRCYSR